MSQASYIFAAMLVANHQASKARKKEPTNNEKTAPKAATVAPQGAVLKSDDEALSRLATMIAAKRY